MTRPFLPVAAPVFAGNEKQYVIDCLDSTWISSTGEYIDRFEASFAKFCHVEHALSCCNGTVALHLALLALGIGPGDEVIVPTLTFVATANAVAYCGATPVFVDSEPATWNMDPRLVEAAITPRTKAIIVVHLYGHPADMNAIMAIAARRGIKVIEDAAEAHGATVDGRPVGSMGHVSTFSFYGNKLITTGEGGMVTTNDAALAKQMRLLRSQGMDPHRRYWFPIMGYNYRMTNVAAAIGLGQLEKAAWHSERRLEVARWYQEEFTGDDRLSWQTTQPWATHIYWIFTVIVADRFASSRDDLMKQLRESNIETRPVFYPMHQLPMYAEQSAGKQFGVADSIARRGINLPTWSGVTRDDVRRVADSLRKLLDALS